MFPETNCQIILFDIQTIRQKDLIIEFLSGNDLLKSIQLTYICIALQNEYGNEISHIFRETPKGCFVSKTKTKPNKNI